MSKKIVAVSSLIFALLLVNFTAGQNSACTSAYKRGTCECELADGSGLLDLTKLSEQTKQNP